VSVDNMKKNIIAIATIGMLLLSCFMITPVLADVTDDIEISNEKPVNGATDVSIFLNNLSFQLNKSYDDNMNYTVGTNPDIIGGQQTSSYVKNDTFFVDITVSRLEWSTVYTWYVNVTLGAVYRNETFTFTTLVQPDTVYVDDDADPSWYDYAHVKTIEEGINNVTVGGTVQVYNGTYQENVVVDKTISLIGDDRDITIINGSGISEVINISADYVVIGGFTIENGSKGIKLFNSSNNIIVENIITDNDYGIYAKFHQQ